MSAHVPPTEAELTWLRWYADECAVPVLARACAEILRLRELCRRAGEYLEFERPRDVRLRRNSLEEVLFRASKGEV